MKANWVRCTHNGTGGTGTLTLAHVTGFPDPFQIWGGTQPTGFTTTVPVEYDINEFTDSTLTVLKQAETGWGRLSIGANIGASTIIRDTPDTSWVDGSPGTYVASGASAVNFGATAANLVIQIGATAATGPQFNPYFDTATGDGLGVMPASSVTGNAALAETLPTSGSTWFMPFRWSTPLLVKRASLVVKTADAGTSNGYFSIYEFGTNGRPGRLLIDLGLLGTSGQSYRTLGNVSTALATHGLKLMPGDYYAAVYSTYANAPAIGGAGSSNSNPLINPGKSGATAGVPLIGFSATGGATPSADPATLTGYASFAKMFLFMLNNA